MAKISGALHVHQNEANLLFISVLTSPTTGGVTASFGMLGDIIVAEPGAIIGFAGRRVIEQTLQEQLPDDFQTAEYLLAKGLLDLVIPRSFLKVGQATGKEPKTDICSKMRYNLSDEALDEVTKTLDIE